MNAIEAKLSALASKPPIKVVKEKSAKMKQAAKQEPKMTYNEIVRLIKNNKPLPSNLTKIGGWVLLEGYNHPLPKSLREISGTVGLVGYNFPLPDSLIKIGGSLYMTGYKFSLPEKLKVEGKIIK